MLPSENQESEVRDSGPGNQESDYLGRGLISEQRKALPMARGLLDYFPAALAAVANVSLVGNEKHNPGQPMHHARSKSRDHADCIMRHLAERGGFDGEIRHSAALAWRALALLQQELEEEGFAPMARGARP